MYKAYKTKLKLNNKQRKLLAKHAGYARWVWNWALTLWSQAYQEGLKPNAQKLKKLFTNQIKPQYQWMRELSSRVYQYTFINLGQAFERFFKKLAVQAYLPPLSRNVKIFWLSRHNEVECRASYVLYHVRIITYDKRKECNDERCRNESVWLNI